MTFEGTFADSSRKASEIRLPELDGIRGLAILFVLLWHCIGAPLHPAYLMRGLDGGFLSIVKQSTIILRSGVDLFLVLSGFLIGGILFDNRKSSRFFPVFYGRRMLRIFPLYYLILVLFVVLKSFGANGVLFDGPIPVFSYLTFTQNYFMAHLGSSGAIWMGATWSLALEEQFYAGFPLLVHRCAMAAMPAVLVAGIILAPILRIWTYFHFGNGQAGYEWLPCRIDALFVGALLAYTLRQPAGRTWLHAKRRLLAAAFVPLFVGFIVLGIAITSDMEYHSMVWGHTFLAYFYGWGILLSVIYAGSGATRFLRARWLTFLGLISYGVYLLHLPVLFTVFGMFSRAVDVNSLREEGLVLLSLATTIVICAASYYVLEKPLIRLGHKWKYSV